MTIIGEEGVSRRDPEPSDRQPGAHQAGREVRGYQGAEEYPRQVSIYPDPEIRGIGGLVGSTSAQACYGSTLGSNPDIS